MEKYLSWTIGIVFVVFATIIAIVSMRYKKNQFKTKEIAIGAMCVALSYGLSWITMIEMPQGGSVTAFSFLPIVIYAYVFGMSKGFIIGTVHGLLQLTQGAVVIHPTQFLLDYGLGFSCIALAALPSLIFKCKNKDVKKSLTYYLDIKNYNILIGILLVGIVRFIVCNISGIIFFWEYAGVKELSAETFKAVFIYSSVYNVTYIAVDIALVFGAALALILSTGFERMQKLMRR